MGMPLLNYYIFKDSIKNINFNITNGLDIDNQIIFKYALFYDISDYYKINNPFSVDHYKLSNKINSDKFEVFLRECLEIAHLHSNLEEKLFCYFIFMSYVIKRNMTPYIEGLISKRKNKDYIEKMIESYYFNINDNLAIHKINLADYFYESFALSENDYKLLEKPIKRVFGFFCTKNYYQSCYNSCHYYYDHHATGKMILKKPLFFFYDIFLNHRKSKPKAKNYMYNKKIDTTILNLNKESYSDHNGKTVNYSLDELYQIILKECKHICTILNDYFLNNQSEKLLNIYFKIK